MNDQSQKTAELQVLQLREALARLGRTSARVVELEKRERALLEQVARLESTIRSDLSENALRAETDIFPASRVDQIMVSLSVTQRREAWLTLLSRLGIDGACYALFPHDGKDDPLTFLVIGSGGFGDMIYLSSFIRSLSERFPRCRIVVLHEHPAAATVFSSNPYVLDVISQSGEARRHFIGAAVSLDIFDLIADVRYVVSYATPPLSRIPESFLLPAHSRAAVWQTYVRTNWPYFNNVLARRSMQMGMSQYGLMNYTANLHSHREAGDFFPVDNLQASLSERLGGRAYVTLHHGADAAMGRARGLQTKNLPAATWAGIAAGLKRAGLVTVQLGEEFESAIEGVDVDLRGQNSFDQTAQVIQFAQAHVDTEGGLVHLAQAVGTTSVVAFGPTPAGYFGYKGNRNLDPPTCGDCWWIGTDWSRRCIRDLDVPECMAGFDADQIVSECLECVDVTKALDVLSVAAVPPGDDPWRAALGNACDAALIVSEINDLLVTPPISADGAPGQVFVPGPKFTERGPSEPTVDYRPFSPGHVPWASDGFDWLGVDFSSLSMSEGLRLLSEAMRITKAGGELLLLLPKGNLLRSGLLDGSLQLPLGTRYRVEPPTPEIVGSTGVASAVPIVLTCTIRRGDWRQLPAEPRSRDIRHGRRRVAGIER